jgi:hypothetical protein
MAIKIRQIFFDSIYKTMRMIPSSAGHQQAQWQINDTKQRAFAASLAVVITIFLSLQFKPRTNIKSELEFLNRPFTLLTFQVTPVARQKVEDQTLTKQSTNIKMRFIPAAVRQAKKVNDTPSAISAEITPEPKVEQDVTLLPINSKSIAKAYKDSKSEIQKMAEASAKELNTPGKTKYDRFQTAAEEAVIPDCFSANAGGTLLSIPVLAYKALAGKCK